MMAIFVLFLLVGSAVVLAVDPTATLDTGSDAATATEDHELVLNILTDDADGTDVTISEPTDDFAGTTFDSATHFVDNGDGTATITWTPIESDVGTHTFTTTVEDADVESIEYTFTVTVEEFNDLPVVSGSDADAVVAEETVTPFYRTFSATDEESDATTLTFSVEDDFSGSTITEALTDNFDGTAEIFWTPTNEDVGVHTVTVRAQDVDGAVSDDATSISFTITVENVNDAPTITAIEDQIADYDSLTGVDFSYQVEASDVDIALASDVLTYTVEVTPAPAVDFEIDATGLLTWTPGAGDAAAGDVYTVTVTVTDLALEEVSTSFDLSLFENTEPVLAGFDADYPVNEDSTVTVSFTATDVDGDALTVTASESVAFVGDYSTTSSFATAHALSDDGAGNYELSWTPANNDVGVHTITVTVQDSIATVTADFTITVSNVNDAPVISTQDQTVVIGGSVTDTIQVEDPEDEAVTFDSWSVTCAACSSATSSLDLDDTSIFSESTTTPGNYELDWTPVTGDLGEHIVSLTFSDATGASTTQSFTITVAEDLSDEEQSVVDLEERFETLEDEFKDEEDELEDAERDDDDRDIEDAEENIEDIEEDVETLKDDTEDLLDEIKDDDDLDEDLQEELEERLEDLLDDIDELLDDISDVLTYGAGYRGDGEAATPYTPPTTTTTTTTTTTSADDDDDEVEITVLPGAETNTPSLPVTFTTENGEFAWENIRAVAWLVAAILVVFALLVFLLALLVGGTKR